MARHIPTHPPPARMDPSLDNLPYQIPGPAGGNSFIATPSQQQNPSKSETTRRFFQSPWQSLLHQLQCIPHGHTHLTSSIALLRAHALQQKFTRFPNLPVLISSLSWVGRDASVTLLDPSATIRATIHAHVFEQYRKGIEPGAALLLDGVTAVAYVERRPAGFRMDADQGLHVSIQTCHVKALFGTACAQPKIDLTRFKPAQSYAEGALNPPVVRVPSRNLQQNRVPLRPRTEFQNAQMRRPSSSGPHVNGFHGRPYQQRKPPGGYRYPQGGGRGASHAPANKRPYAPPQVRHTGMQPPQKRPAVSRTQYAPPAPANVQVAGKAQDGGAGGLTDDQLDALLGDFDMDAAIAASGKSQAVSQVAPAKSSAQEDENVQQDGGSSLDVETKAGSDGVSQAVSTEVADGKTEQKPLSGVDEAMIDSLLDGIDDSDFK